MHEKPSIAVVILAFNESVHLPRALHHVRSFAREIFVIDSFSTDDTVEHREGSRRARPATSVPELCAPVRMGA